MNQTQHFIFQKIVFHCLPGSTVLMLSLLGGTEGASHSKVKYFSKAHSDSLWKILERDPGCLNPVTLA